MKGKAKSMIDIRQIIQRLRDGQFVRQINRELGIHRSIIRKVNDLAIAYQWLNPDSTMPTDEEITTAWKNKTATTDTEAHPLDHYKPQIEQWHNQGITSVVIHRLLQDNQCLCDIQAIRRYRKKHFPQPIRPVMVRSTEAGRDMEVDFGELGRFCDDDGEIKKFWLFSLRLRHSRKAYREVVSDQTSKTFLMGHVHAFEYFNGVPKNCILDNLKAGVIKSTIDNDQVNRAYQILAEYYGFIISPCIPRIPRHKGGVEGDVKFTKGNFLPYFLEKQKATGCTIPSKRALIDALDKWTQEVDNRIVQGVGSSPNMLFSSEEQKALHPLPEQRWEPISWSKCVIRRDWRFMLDSAYYSVHYRLIGKTVDVCSSNALVRVFYENQEVAVHERATKKGEYKRKTEHAPPEQEAVLSCSREGLLAMADDIGPCTRQLIDGMFLSKPFLDKLRPVRHLLRLAIKYSKERLEKACQRALKCKLFSYASVKNILEKNLDIAPLNVSNDKVVHLENYRFGRDLSDYKSEAFSHKETFQETLERTYYASKHGHGMLPVFEAIMADQIIEESLKEENE